MGRRAKRKQKEKKPTRKTSPRGDGIKRQRLCNPPYTSSPRSSTLRLHVQQKPVNLPGLLAPPPRPTISSRLILAGPPAQRYRAAPIIAAPPPRLAAAPGWGKTSVGQPRRRGQNHQLASISQSLSIFNFTASTSSQCPKRGSAMASARWKKVLPPRVPPPKRRCRRKSSSAAVPSCSGRACRSGRRRGWCWRRRVSRARSQSSS